MSSAIPTPRQHYLDWIRVIAFGLLIFYHCGMFFVSWGWHVKNNEIVRSHEVWMGLLNPWRLPLLFFISGVGVSFAMKRRSIGQFIGERTRRLLLPLIFGMFVVVPPQIYFERLQRHQFDGSYLDFYPKVLEFIPYPQGNFSWHHLWFIVYLWVFSLLASGLFAWLKSKPATLFPSVQSSGFFRLFLFFLPMTVCYIFLSKQWPVTHNLISDWYNFTLSLYLFVVGYIIGRQPQAWEIMDRYRKTFLTIAVSIIVFSKSFDAIFHPLPETDFYVVVINGFLRMIFVWCMILAVGGFARHYLNRENTFIDYANRAVYPFYILHQTITVSLGYWMADALWNPTLKFILLSAGTFLFSWIIYHFLIRQWLVTRTLFGVK